MGHYKKQTRNLDFNPWSLIMGRGEKRIVANCVELWLWGVFTKLGKRRGSVCTANFSCFNITGDTATVSSNFGCLGDLFFGGGLWFFLQARGRKEIYGVRGARGTPTSAQHPALGVPEGKSLVVLKHLKEDAFLHSRSEM